jgi:hypothetical protein
MRTLTIAIILGIFAMLARPALAEGPLTARTDAQKDEDARIDKAYREATRGGNAAPAAKNDPWATVRPADADSKKTKH